MLNEYRMQKVNSTIELTKDEKDYVVCLKSDKQSKYVLSKYNPKREADKIVEGKIKNKEMICIILGFGAGYVVQKIKDMIENQGKIIIVDPDIEFVKKQIRFRKLEELLNNSNVIFFSGKSFKDYERLLNEQIQVVDVFNTEVIPHQEYLLFYTEYFKSIISITAQHLRKLEVIKNTISKNSEMHINNLLKNLSYLLKSADSKEIQDIYKGIPAVIVSGGPSLSKNIDELTNFQGLILAMGRTVKPLKDRGIEPNFLASIDPGDGIVVTFQGESENTCPLITTPISNHKVIKSHKGKIYFIGSAEEMNLTKQLGVSTKMQELPIGGSVANTLCSMAYYMGCDPIVFIGQDLAYTDGKLHDSNTVQSKVLTEESQYKYIDGYYGEKVRSYPDLIIFLKWFEEFIEGHSDRTYINATQGGAKIKGTIQMDLKKVIEKYGVGEFVSLPSNEYSCSDDNTVKSKLVKIKNMLKIAEKSAKKGKKLSAELKKEYEIYKGERINVIQNIIETLNKDIDAKIKNQKELGIAKQIFESISLQIETGLKYKIPIQESLIQEGIRVANNSYELYNSLELAFEKTIKIIDNQEEKQEWRKD